MSFLEALKKESNKTFTENGALAHFSTESDVLDLFALGGSIRSLEEEKVVQLILGAITEGLDLGLRVIMYLSDIREGQGERKFFKTALKVIMENCKENVVKAVIDKIPELTRWDYMFEFFDTKYEDYVMDKIVTEIHTVLEEPVEAVRPTSLLFKWLPSIQRNPYFAKKIAKELKYSNKQYRQMLSSERARLKVVEADMSAKRWGEINYSHVPSKAGMIYRNAFKRNDEDRYTEFIEAATKGEVKINAGTLYPHEIISKGKREVDPSLDVLWNNLPDYSNGSEHNAIAIVDTSGSMQTYIDYPNSQVEAIDVAIGMGIYMAERMGGHFKNHFISFSETPRLHTIKGDTIYAKYRNLRNGDWGFSTNFEASFDLLLNTAIKNNIDPSEMPATVVCFSDMEFDAASDRTKTPFESIKRRFEAAGYKLPQLVFWNLNARNRQHPVTQDESGTILVSGFSPITLKYVLTNELKTPYELMLEVILKERYKVI